MFRRFLTATVLVVALAGVAGCGEEDDVKFGETEGVYLTVADVKYQVEISRVLNPADAEDRQYLYGIPAAQAQIPANSDWFAVFVRAHNDSKTESHRTASSFRIEDTTGSEFTPLSVPADANPHAWHETELGPEATFPEQNTTAGGSTTAGAVLLFKIPTDTFARRPLELHIEAPDGSGDAVVDLDV
ncbi:MAG TPA: hypothetical protein VNT22_06555 [Baekduia sp.]|nr:hypothetical protein [Baekduia sp.]